MNAYMTIYTQKSMGEEVRRESVLYYLTYIEITNESLDQVEAISLWEVF